MVTPTYSKSKKWGKIYTKNKPIPIYRCVSEDETGSKGQAEKLVIPDGHRHNDHWEAAAFPFAGPSDEEIPCQYAIIRLLPRFNEATGELIMPAENSRRILLTEALMKCDYGQLFLGGFPVPYNPEEVLPTYVVQELESVLLLNPGTYRPRTIQGLHRGTTRTEQFLQLARAEHLQKAVEEAAAEGKPFPEELLSYQAANSWACRILFEEEEEEVSSFSSEEPLPISFRKDFINRDVNQASLLTLGLQECAAIAIHKDTSTIADSGSDCNPEEEWNVPTKNKNKDKGTAPAASRLAPKISPSVYSQDEPAQQFGRVGVPLPIVTSCPHQGPAEMEETSRLFSLMLTWDTHRIPINVGVIPSRFPSLRNNTPERMRIATTSSSNELLAPPRQTSIKWKTPSPDRPDDGDAEQGPQSRRIRLQTARQVRDNVTVSWDTRRSPRRARAVSLAPRQSRQGKSIMAKLKTFFGRK
jgi:hypothetical protein